MARVIIDIDDILYKKLNMALEISDKNLNEVFSQFVEKYIILTKEKLQKMIDELKGEKAKETSNDNIESPYGDNYYKGVSRIPDWARKPHQYNHKIIRAFLQLEKEKTVVTIKELESRCSDKEQYPNVFVPTFSNNFSQMKFDEGKSHGKIFEERYGEVTIWDKARAAIEENRKFFE